MNRLDSKFMVFIPSDGRLRVGKFADYYYPKLNPVSDDDKDPAAFRKASSLFRAQTELGVGVHKVASGYLSSDNKRLLDTKSVNRDFIREFDSNGYIVTGSAELKYMIGGALFLDGIQIARSSLWKSKAKGHFSENLLREVIEGGEKNPSVRHLRFIALDCNPIGEGQKMAYDFMYSKSLMAFDPGSKREFIEAVTQLRDFTYALEDYFKPGAPGSDNDKIEYSRRDREKDLDSPEFEEDRSYDSYYYV